MKLAWKIFFVTYVIVIISAGTGGIALLELAVSSMLDSVVQRAVTTNRYSGEMLMTYFNQGTDVKSRKSEIQQNIAKICSTEKTDELAIYAEDDLPAHFDDSSFVYDLENLGQGYFFTSSSDGSQIVAVCRTDYSGKKYYSVTSCSLSQLSLQKKRLTAIYGCTVFGIAVFAGVALFILSRHFAKPITELAGLADKISDGNYENRIPETKQSKSSEEIEALTNSFNKMAQAVSDNINGLREEIEKRDIFVADFTHELKTPMTSIIGYADMLRSYSLPPAETREISDTIYREGKRLQQLSMRLLDIIILKNQEIKLSNIRTDAFFEGFKKSVYFVSQKFSVDIITEYQSAVIMGENELLLSLLYNLTENACKASSKSQTVYVRGEICGDKYIISVLDSGTGIKKESLNKITEPFFTEDKSRSRAFGGAGLGLALCRQIAYLHDTELVFDSTLGKGTTVSFSLTLYSGKFINGLNSESQKEER